MTEQLFYAKKDSEYVNEEVLSGEFSLGAKEGDFFFDTRFNDAKIEEIKKRFGNDIEAIRIKPEEVQIKTYKVWLEFPFAGAEPVEIEVTSNLTGNALEKELRGAIMNEANIEWGFEEID